MMPIPSTWRSCVSIRARARWPNTRFLFLQWIEIVWLPVNGISPRNRYGQDFFLRISRFDVLVIHKSDKLWRTFRSGQVWGHTPVQRVAASTLRRYLFGLRLAIAQADAKRRRRWQRTLNKKSKKHPSVPPSYLSCYKMLTFCMHDLWVHSIWWLVILATTWYGDISKELSCHRLRQDWHKTTWFVLV